MHLVALSLIAILLGTLAYNIPYAKVAVSFHEGQYDPDLVSRAGGKVVKEFRNLEMLYAMVPLSAMAAIKGNDAVEFVEEDAPFEISADEEYTTSWGVQSIGAEEAHDSKDTGAGIRVAVLDTGIDYKHPELSSNYRGGYDFINDDDDPMDDNGHGTHVAGIIAAERNGEGIVGVAPEAEMYAIKVSDKKGKGSFSGLVDGINWAIENEINVVTMSITGKGGTQALHKAVKTAYNEYGIILVAAVGNGKTGSVLYPAAYDEVIGVGSVTKENKKSPFSLTGSEVELVAPGSLIKSTWIKSGYKVSSGTSMAAPFVTGAIALLLGSDEADWKNSGSNGDGKWTNDEIRKVLRSNTVDLGKKGKDDQFGYGLLSLESNASDPPTTTASVPKFYSFSLSFNKS